jgi:V-type H+-transporting ATPase subunit D
MSELDELDREEFYRLKKVQGKKRRDGEEADKERLALKAAQEEKDDHSQAENKNVLGDDDDEDVLFR